MQTLLNRKYSSELAQIQHVSSILCASASILAKCLADNDASIPYFEEIASILSELFTPSQLFYSKYGRPEVTLSVFNVQ